MNTQFEKRFLDLANDVSHCRWSLIFVTSARKPINFSTNPICQIFCVKYFRSCLSDHSLLLIQNRLQSNVNKKVFTSKFTLSEVWIPHWKILLNQSFNPPAFQFFDDKIFIDPKQQSLYSFEGSLNFGEDWSVEKNIAIESPAKVRAHAETFETLPHFRCNKWLHIISSPIGSEYRTRETGRKHSDRTTSELNDDTSTFEVSRKKK